MVLVTFFRSLSFRSRPFSNGVVGSTFCRLAFAFPFCGFGGCVSAGVAAGSGPAEPDEEAADFADSADEGKDDAAAGVAATGGTATGTGCCAVGGGSEHVVIRPADVRTCLGLKLQCPYERIAAYDPALNRITSSCVSSSHWWYRFWFVPPETILLLEHCCLPGLVQGIACASSLPPHLRHTGVPPDQKLSHVSPCRPTDIPNINRTSSSDNQIKSGSIAARVQSLIRQPHSLSRWPVPESSEIL